MESRGGGKRRRGEGNEMELGAGRGEKILNRE
jgi:hypothetical protein